MEYTLKELVGKDNSVSFVRYFDGCLWYTVRDRGGLAMGFEFPVPIEDIGNATFLAEDRAILFMRYIRKHLEMLAKAKEEK